VLERAAGRGVGLAGQPVDGAEEPPRLAVEQPVGGEAPDRGDSAAETVERGTHDRARGQSGAQERGRLGQDQVGLVELAALGVQIGERGSDLGVGDAVRDPDYDAGW
jgi:hypothetical protein